MREFRPPVRPSVLRVVLAIVLPLVIAVPMGGLVFLALGVTQPSYTIGDGALSIKSGDFFAGDRTIRLADVTETRVVTLRGGRRTAGTALPGFCGGRFSYPDLGTVWHVTNCTRRVVLIRATGQDLPIVITPPDVDGFVDRLRSGTPTEIVMPPADKGPLVVVAAVVAPLIMISIVMLSLLLLLGPARMRYVVGDGALEVHTLFGRKRWQTAGARAKAYTPVRLWRVAGSSMPGYHTGMFRESGRSTRVYATALDRVLLFEGADRVMLSPEDRVEMLRALEEQGVVIERHAV
jgi:hypothetical protein